jgi:uncharacterized protein (UPF0548 family)
MKRQWQTRRTAVATATGQQRWDQAYQLLLQWATTQPGASTPPADREEVPDARSDLLPRLDDAAGAAADD